MSRTTPPPSNINLHDDAALRAQLAAIVDSSDDAIVGKTLDGIITSWNRGAQQLFGYSAIEAVGQHIFLIVPDDRRAEEQEVLARLRRGEKIDHFETVRRTKDGRLVTISLTVSPIRDANGVIVGASKVARDITERQRAQLFTRLVLAQEDERRRISREMHDRFGEQLTALARRIGILKDACGQRAELMAHVEALETVAQQLDRDVDRLVWELRPTALDDLGLRAALANYVQDWSRRVGIPAEVHTTGLMDDRLRPDVETALYRIAQEALTNVAKHSHACNVDVILERRADHVLLIVEDDGVGFDAGEADSEGRGFGLLGMQERAALVGATLEIESAAGQGTAILVRMDVATPPVTGFDHV